MIFFFDRDKWLGGDPEVLFVTQDKSPVGSTGRHACLSFTIAHFDFHLEPFLTVTSSGIKGLWVESVEEQSLGNLVFALAGFKADRHLVLM